MVIHHLSGRIPMLFGLLIALGTGRADAQKWMQLPKPATLPTPDLYGVTFFTRDSGYVCGELGGGGRLYLTLDGGTTWRDATASLPGAPGPLYDIQFLPGGIGAVAGDAGYVAVTTDHGASWSAANITAAAWPSGGDIQGIHFKNALEGFAAGRPAGSGSGPRLARTVDGGRSWSNVPQTGPQNNLYDVDFFDDRHGVVVGTGANARKSVTSDGGESWEPNGRIGSDPTTSMSFYGVDAVAGTGIAYASGGVVVGSERFTEVRKTTDFGVTWTATSLTRGFPGNTKAGNSVLAVSDQLLFASTQGFRIYRSNDGGEHWSAEILPPGNSNDLRRFCITPTDEIYAVGRGGTVLRMSLVPHIAMASPSLAFARSCAGTSLTVDGVIRNAGHARLRIDSIALLQPSRPGATYTVVEFPAIIAPGDSGRIVVRADLDPAASPGLYAGELRIHSNDSNYLGADTVKILPVSAVIAPRTLAVDGTGYYEAVPTGIGRRGVLKLPNALINPGECPVTVTGAHLAAGTDFSLGAFSSMTIAPGGQADLELIFEPVAPCLRYDTIIVEHDADSLAPLRVPVAGTGLERSFSTSPDDTLRFSSVPVGGSIDGILELINVKIGGCLDSTGILSFRIDGPERADFTTRFEVSPGSAVAIPPHEKLRVPITATPSGTGRRVAYAIVTHDLPGSLADTVVLLVNGAKAELVCADESIVFGSSRVGTGRDSALDGYLINFGNAESRIDSVRVSGIHPDEFRFDGPTPPFRVASGSRETIHLGFTPAAPGRREALLDIYADGRSDPLTVSLAGDGVLPEIIASGDAVAFRRLRIGECADTLLSAFLHNGGTFPLRISRLRIAPDPAGIADDSTAFTIVGAPLPPDLTLPPAASLSVAIRFCPRELRPHTALLLVDHDAGDGPLAIRLSGPTESVADVMIDSVIFPPLLVANGRDSIVARFLANSSDGPISIDSLRITGPAAGSYLLLSPDAPFALAPGDDRALALRFQPPAVGISEAELAIFQSGVRTPTHRITLLGKGLALAIAYEPALAGIDFGNVRNGTGRDSLISLTNLSGAPLTIDELSMEGPEAFTIESPPSVPIRLQPAVPLQLRVRFAPNGLGPRRGWLRIRSGTVADSSFILAGNGVEPVLRADVDTIDFGGVNAGSLADTVVRLLNEPTTDIPIPAYIDAAAIRRCFIVGDSSFAIISFPPDQVAANARDAVRIRFTAPSRAGVCSGRLLVVHDGRVADGAPAEDTLSIELLARADIVPIRLNATLGTDISGMPGDTLRVPIILSGLPDSVARPGVDTLDVRLGFPGTMLRPVGVVPRGASTAAFLLHDSDPRSGVDVRVLVDRGLGSGIVAEVALTVLLGDGLAAVIRYNSIAVPGRSDITFLTDSVRFTVTGICDPEGRLIRFDSSLMLASKPNPAYGATVIEYTLPAIANVHLGVYDAGGTEIARLADGPGYPGSYAVPFNASTLSPGTYYCVLTAGNFTTTIIIRVMR